MLRDFLTTHRSRLLQSCREKAARRVAPATSGKEMSHGIPRFLDQVIKTLDVERSGESNLSRAVSGPSGGGAALSEIGVTATLHGRELSDQGFSVEQVVHDYGDLCQAITDLAFELRQAIEVDEFRTLNRCLDNGIAEAVSEYALQRSSMLEAKATRALNEQLGFLAHELRNLIFSATLAVRAMRAGKVGLAGATGSVLDQSLIGMRALIDRTLAEVRLTDGQPPHLEPTSLKRFIDEVMVSASLEADDRKCRFTVAAVDPTLAVDIDRELLLSAVGNLVQNAFKFTAPGTEVSLNAYPVGDRIRIEVEDHCGGLAPDVMETMFQPFRQNGQDRSGVGLGLTICRRSAEANRGALHVRSIDGSGCIFTIELPRHLG